MNDFISIVIPTYNRGKLLLDVLPSYLRQKYVKEIIIVDDFSNDNTETLIRKYSSTHNKVKYIKNNIKPSWIETLNIGLRFAVGSYIFIGESDVELSDNYLEILFRHLQKENADIISGRRIWGRINESKHDTLIRANKSKGLLINYKTLLTNFELTSENDISLCLLDACMLLRKSVADLVQFDTNLFRDVVAWRGESDFQLSAVEHGFKLIFCPHTYCYHYPRKYKNLFQTIKYDYHAFKNNYLFLRKHKNFINNNLEIKSIAIIYLFGLFIILKGNFLIFCGKVKKSLAKIFYFKKSKN